MNGFIKNFMVLGGILTLCFGAYQAVTNKPEQSIKENKADLEKKIESERVAVIAYVNIKDQAKTEQLNDVKATINEKFGLLMNKLEKMDDRLYDLQRDKQINKDARSIASEEENGG